MALLVSWLWRGVAWRSAVCVYISIILNIAMARMYGAQSYKSSRPS